MAEPDKPRTWTQYCAYRKTKHYSSWVNRFKPVLPYLRNRNSLITEVEANFTLNKIILDAPERARWRFDDVDPETIEDKPARGFPFQVDVIGDPKRGTQIIAYYEILPFNSPPKDVRCDIFWIAKRKCSDHSSRKIITNFYKDVLMNLSTGHIENGPSFLSGNRRISRELREEAPEALKELGDLIRKYGKAQLETFGMDRDSPERGR